MAFGFVKKEWKPRIVEFPGRRRLDDTSTADVYDVSRAEGNIIQAGDSFTADNMNDLEKRVDDALFSVDTEINQLNENIELRTIKNVSLIFATATVAATSGELGGYYAMIDLDKASNITFPGGLKAILPLGCTRTDATGYVGVVAPYNWKSAYLITKQWAITAPTSGTYGVMFACFY